MMRKSSNVTNKQLRHLTLHTTDMTTWEPDIVYAK